MTKNERLNKVFIFLKKERLVYTQRDFSDIVGQTPSVVSEMLNNKRDVSEVIIRNICNKFSEVNTDWLLTGEGEMLKQTEKQETVEIKQVNQSTDDYKLVPLYNMDARGGFGANDEVDYVEYIVDRIPFKDAKETDICVPVSGKSMMPTYCPGTVVLLHEIENWVEFLETGQIYVLILKDGRRLIKELRRSEEDRQANYLCISHNPDYEPVELPRKLIHKVYMVTAMYQKTTI